MGKTNISGCGFAHGSKQVAGKVTEKRPFVPLVGARWEVSEDGRQMVCYNRCCRAHSIIGKYCGHVRG